MDIDTFRNNNCNYETLPFGTIIMPDIIHATSRAGGSIIASVKNERVLRQHTHTSAAFSTKLDQNLGGARLSDTELSSYDFECAGTSPSPQNTLKFAKETTQKTTSREDMLDLSTTTSSRNIGSNLRLKRNTPVRRNNKSLFDTMNIRRKDHDGE